MTATVRVQPRLWRIYRRMDLAALTEQGDEDGDPLGLATREGRTRLGWETYSRGGLEYALRAYGTLERLEGRGLGKLSVNLDLGDPFAPTIVVRSHLFAAPVVEASLRQVSGHQLGLGRAVNDVPLLFLESLLLQNPGKQFDWHRPPLPGQQFPGLSLSGEVIQLLLLMARRVGAEGMALRPSSFHAAWAYARHFVFVDGTAQARFEALRREPRLRPLWLLSWALDLGCVRSGAERVTWTPDSDDRATGWARGQGGELRRAQGGGAAGKADCVPVRPRLPPPALPLGAHAGATGAQERAGPAPPPSWRRLSGPDASAPCLYWRERGARRPTASPRGLARGKPRPVDEKELRPRHQRPAARPAVHLQLRRQQRRHPHLRHRGGRQVQARPVRARPQRAPRRPLPGRVPRRGLARRGRAAAQRRELRRRLHPPRAAHVAGRRAADGQPHPRGRARRQGARARAAGGVHHQGHLAPHPRRRPRPHRPGLRRPAGRDLRALHRAHRALRPAARSVDQMYKPGAEVDVPGRSRRCAQPVRAAQGRRRTRRTPRWGG